MLRRRVKIFLCNVPYLRCIQRNSTTDIKAMEKLIYQIKPVDDNKISNISEGNQNRDMYDRDGYIDKDVDLDIFEKMENDEINPSHRLGKYLLKYSRVFYRQVGDYSEWFNDKRQEIIKYRTPAQIRRCLKTWMLDTNQYEKQKKFLTKPLKWRNDDADSKNAADVKVYGPDETIAYAHYFMPSRYTITKRLLNELKLYLPKFRPSRVLDYGCGPGTAGAAIIDTWDSDGMKKYTGVDMSQAMIDSAKILLDGHSDVDAIFYNKISDVAKRVERLQDRYDLVIISFTLSELTTDAARRAAVQIGFEMLDVGGVLLILEQGNPIGSHTVRTARQFILDNFGNQIYNKSRNKMDSSDDGISLLMPMSGYDRYDLGVKTIAPCTHDKPCPLAPGIFCSFSQKALSGMIRKESEEKFSYVLLQKVITNQVKLEQYQKDSKYNQLSNSWTNNTLDDIDKLFLKSKESLHPTPREVLMRFQKCDDYDQVEQLMDNLIDEVDWEEYNPPLYRDEWSRVIRSPIKGKGHTTIDVCTPYGRINRTVLARSNVMNIPSLFVSIRKTTWGGLFPSDIKDPKDLSQSVLTYATKKSTIEANHHFNGVLTQSNNQSKPTQRQINDVSKHIRNDTSMKKQIILSQDTQIRPRMDNMNEVRGKKSSSERANRIENTLSYLKHRMKKDQEVESKSSRNHSSGISKTLEKLKLKRKTNKE